MKISARNQLKGTVVQVEEGAVNGIVSIDIGGQVLKSDITMEAIKDLGLVAGTEAFAVIKASNVLIAALDAPITCLSARNQLVGTVSKAEKGAVNGLIVVDIADGVQITSSITNEAIDALELAAGKSAVAIIKATDVLTAVN